MRIILINLIYMCALSDDMAELDTRRWQVGKSLTQCLSHMLQNEITTDVTFLVASQDSTKPTTRISAHKFMLRARSPVFEVMFGRAYVESSSNDVEIIDSEPEHFRDMLR